MSQSWKCTICGIVAPGDHAPERCPECGAVQAMFEASSERPHGIAHNPLQPRDERDQTPLRVGPGRGCLEVE